ncbi:MAG: SUMF1/EgtB/PvdO family nonheme iron enzyme [Saprospiraceae bacterium]|nr:SUMF1/EgtB/PvdO family nonheme iron enzyme [Saprospiraceae bacterium]
MSLEERANRIDRIILKRIEEDLVPIPAGRLAMRDDRTGQSWIAQVPSFHLSKYLVTQQLFEEVMGISPSTFKGPRHPVETISWKDAATFCNELSFLMELNPSYQFAGEEEGFYFNHQANGYRLPTEAEWEYACRAGSSGIRYGELDAIAWYRANAAGSTHEVGQKLPNSWGLFDMIGNVWEWCADIYDATVYGSYRIIRGGGWYDEARGCMVTNRRRSHPTAYKIDDLGFRIARNS